MPFLKNRTYLDADGRAVSADSPDAATLLGQQGDEITEEDATRYGAETSDSVASETAEQQPQVADRKVKRA